MNISLKNLSAEQRKAMLEMLQAEEKVAEEQKKQNIETYKQLVNDTVLEAFPKLQEVSTELAEKKGQIRAMFDTVAELKTELYGMKESQWSHQFMDNSGQFRIRVGSHTVDNYDDTVNVGIGMVRGYIKSLANSEETEILVDTVLKLLSKDNKGTLKASRVLQLQQMAEKSGDKRFMEGVRIIRDAYHPIESKSYIRAEYKDDHGAWISVPLGMTEAMPADKHIERGAKY